MSFQKYETLEEDPISSEDTDGLLTLRPNNKELGWRSRFGSRFFNVAIVALLVLAVVGDALLAAQVVSLNNKHNVRMLHPKTDYVDLRMDIPVEISEDYVSLHDPFWNSPRIDPSLGIVALDDEFVKKKNLPESLVFPWDKSKSVYILSFHHSFHCLRWIRQSILESHTGRPQSADLSHLTHCVNVLLSDVQCHADDTPRYSGIFDSRVNMTNPKSGLGQLRQCVDFDKLYDFAIENSACYREPHDPNAPVEDYFKSCPDGRVLWDE